MPMIDSQISLKIIPCLLHYMMANERFSVSFLEIFLAPLTSGGHCLSFNVDISVHGNLNMSASLSV